MSILTQLLSKVHPHYVLASPSPPNPEQISRQILDELFRDFPLTKVGFRFWNGAVWPEGSEGRDATIVLTRPSALREMLLPGSETGVGEAYLSSAFEVEGQIEASFQMADCLMQKTGG